MVWNVILYSHYSNEKLYPLRGYDGRPLRFADKRYADREAHDLNSKYLCELDPLQSEGITYTVFEDNGDYGYHNEANND